MIQVKINEREQEPQQKPFPKLMITTSDSNVKDRIILFTSETHGVVINVGSLSSCYAGEYGEWNSNVFVDYNEPITIQNT